MSKLDQLKALGAAKTASRKSSDGGVESRHATSGTGSTLRPSRQPEASSVGVAPGPSEATDRKKAGLKVKSLPRKGPPGDGVSLTSIAHPDGLIDKIADALRSDKLSRGRPKIVDKRPWELQGISRRTWYRRQKK